MRNKWALGLLLATLVVAAGPANALCEVGGISGGGSGGSVGGIGSGPGGGSGGGDGDDEDDDGPKFAIDENGKITCKSGCAGMGSPKFSRPTGTR